MPSTTARTGRLLAGLVAGALTLTACSDAAATLPAGVGETDVAFAQEMIPHHQGALEMSEMALERAEDPRVRDLAERIEAAQEPEIDLLSGWLAEWGVDPADGAHGGDHGGGAHGGGDHGGGDHGGMAGMDQDGGMSVDEMGDADGAAFDLMWLRAMIAHHEGAVEMAETEIADGQDEDAVELARTIASSQRAEIDQMRALVAELGG